MTHPPLVIIGIDLIRHVGAVLHAAAIKPVQRAPTECTRRLRLVREAAQELGAQLLRGGTVNAIGFRV